MDSYVLPTFMSIAGEVSSHSVCVNAVVDSVAVFPKSIHESASCLSHILLVASATSNAVNQIVASACEVSDTPVSFAGYRTGDFSSFVQIGAVSACESCAAIPPLT